MSDKKPIEHSGIVERIDSEGILVKIVSQSACASCHAKGYCSSSDMEEKEVLIKDFQGIYSKGETVNVLLQPSQGMNAIMIGYVYPFLLLISLLLVLTSIGIAEMQAGIISFLVLIPYYFILFLLKDRINKKFSFSLRKTF
jgi:sigma-E factor negative regulatory protein RseC